ncbi:uracil-DNA glycosylase [Candidatus Micrarchaeota archaeon]|nr:uracil-DNA glycosylase [Candidatus Micrarchaeota archaeon]
MTLEEIAERIRRCRKCPLYAGRTNPVPGEGDPKARIMLVGEAPGAKEDETGRPFVGASGKILRQTLEGVGIKEKEVFIGNIVKCRPPGNRNPHSSEVEICTSNYLEKQIKAIKPRVIVPLGNVPTNYFLKKYNFDMLPINSVAGKRFNVNNTVLVPNFHPAYILYRRSVFPKFKSIFKKISKLK